MKRLLHFLLLAPLVACGQPAPTTNNQTVEAPAQDTAAADDSQLWKPPAAASKRDKALIIDWFKANDGCQGGINVLPDDPICKKRDALDDRLRKHGWCWGAPLDKSAANDDWHRCGAYDSDNLTTADADVKRGMTAPSDDGRGSPDSHAGDWYDEKQRAKSPLLQAYENAVEPIDQKIGLANVLTECGIRGTAWHQQMLATLEDRKHQPSIDEMGQRLSAIDAAAAKRFDQIVIDGQSGFMLTGQPKEAACRSIANMPFAANDATFQR